MLESLKGSAADLFHRLRGSNPIMRVLLVLLSLSFSTLRDTQGLKIETDFTTIQTSSSSSSSSLSSSSVRLCASETIQPHRKFSSPSIIQCALSCYNYQPTCLGFNYRRQPSQSSTCELFTLPPICFISSTTCTYYQRLGLELPEPVIETLESCGSNTCLNGASCWCPLNSNNGFVCNCTEGFTGTLCEIEIPPGPCGSFPCKNGASCVNTLLLLDYTCTCQPGYTDPTCSTDIDECNSSPCLNGSCVNNVNSFTCNCDPGYTDTTCSTEIDWCADASCQNGATCVEQGEGYQCNCVAGYTGADCDTEIDECSSSPCKYGGQCTDSLNSFICTCAPGYSGPTCTSDSIDDCTPNACLNGGTCTDGISTFTCSCVAGYTDHDCSTDIDECASDPCMNNGTCTDAVNGFKCACQPGVFGVSCSLGFPVRLINTKDLLPHHGRPEIYHDGEWGTISAFGISEASAKVLCRGLHLTYMDGITFQASDLGFGVGSGKIWLAGLACDGSELHVDECFHNFWGLTGPFTHAQDLGIYCTEEDPLEIPVGLVPKGGLLDLPLTGTLAPKGTYQMQFDGVWGGVCYATWAPNPANAMVACTELGHTSGIAIPATFGYPAPNLIWLGEVVCTGMESRIRDCPKSGWGDSSCSTSQSTALSCS